MKLDKDIKQKLNKKGLENLTNISFNDGKELLNGLNDKLTMRLYARNCTNEELKLLVSEWSVKCPERIELLKKALKKERKVVLGLF